jgi:hypothetical protein
MNPSLPGAWHQRIRRIGQVNMNERDPIELDVERWADYFAGLEVDAVLVSVTGIVAFYPTSVADFRPARHLGGRDLFGECARAAKKRGIRVIARMSPDLQWEDMLQKHPDWFVRDKKGQPVEGQTSGLYRTCMYSSYFDEQIPAIIREVNERYGVDAFYTNGWPSLHAPEECWCASCRSVPKDNSPEYHERHLDRIIEIWKKYDALARDGHPESVYFANLGQGIDAVPNIKKLAEAIEIYNCDHQGRNAGDQSPLWGCAQQGRVARSVTKGRTVLNVSAAWSTGLPRYRNVAKSVPESLLWLAQAAASGMVPWYHWIGGQAGLGEDRRWHKPGQLFMQWLARNERHFFNSASIADVGVVFSQRMHLWYTPPAGETRHPKVTDALQGLYYTLLEGRFFFDLVHEDDLSLDSIGRYKALLLPNLALLSDQQCRQLREYVEHGGSLLATFETSLYDEKGQPRKDFGLSDVLGVRKAGDRQLPVAGATRMNATYARLERDHEILRGFGDTNWIAGGEFWIPVRTTEDNNKKKAALTVVPSYPAYPPELAYTDQPSTDHPAMVTREKGGSRVVYFAADVERTCWQTGHNDLIQLQHNAIRWLLRGRESLRLTGDGLVEAFAYKTEPGYAVHVLNYNNPNLHRGWIRKHYPVGAQTVRMEIPAQAEVGTVTLLRAERDVPFALRDGILEFEIPSVTDYEVAAIVPR